MSRHGQHERQERRLRAWLAGRTPDATPASLYRALERLGDGDVMPTERVRADDEARRARGRGRSILLGLGGAAVVALVAIGTGLLAVTIQRQAPAASPGVSMSAVPGTPGPTASAPGPQGLRFGVPLLVGQRTGVKAALADTASGPVVSIYPAQIDVPGTLPLASRPPVGRSCPASPVGIVGPASVTWSTAAGSILYLAGDASAPGPAGIGFTPDCGHMTVLAPATATSWTVSDAPSPLAVGVWFLGMKPGDPSMVVAWSPATGQAAMKGGFISWSSDGGHTWQSQTSPSIPAGWDWSGTFWQLAPGRLVSSRGPGVSLSGPSVPVDQTWDPSAGQVPPVVATAVFRDRVLLAPRDDAALESVGTEGSGTARLAIAAWRISAGSRLVAVEGKDLGSGAPTLAISSDGVHFVTMSLPAEFASASTDSVQVLALDDRVLLTDWPQTADPADQVIHVWSVPVVGVPEPPAAPTPVATPAIPSAPPAEVTSTWAPITLPRTVSNGAFGGPGGGIAALPGGGFIDFVAAAPTRTLVFTSADGSHWTQTGEVTGEDAAGISGPVATNGQVYVALGAQRGGTYYPQQSNGAAWASPDLRHWTKAPDQPAFGGAEFGDVAAGPAGFVATGFDQGGQSVWASEDGLRWSVVTDLRAFPPNVSSPGRIVRTSGGLLIVGALNEQAAVWTSLDGQSWTVHSPISGASNVLFDGLALGQAGYVTLGTAAGGPGIEVSPGDFRFPVVPFVSSDGLAWRAGPSSPALFGARIGGTSLVAAPGGFVATGMVGSEVELWTSRDGLDWVAVGGVDLTGVNESKLVSDGRHVLLVASGQSDTLALVSAGVVR